MSDTMAANNAEIRVIKLLEKGKGGGKCEMKAIIVEKLSKVFPGGTVAVDGIRFLLNQGEMKKSTFL